MDFKLTAQQQEFRDKIRDFAEKKVAPVAAANDRESHFPLEQVRELCAMGVFGTPFPKEWGGAGLSALSYAIAVEELSRVDGSTGVALSAHVSLGAWPIFNYGTQAQKEKYLRPLASGEKLGAFGLTEPNAGSDAGGTQTTAVLEGDHYLLNGSKIFITNSGYADIYIIFAMTTPGIGSNGISAFIVERDYPGFTVAPHYDKMGIRASATAQLDFKNVSVPRENLLGKEGEGFKIAMATLDGGRIGIAAQALGIAQGAFEEALNYAREREQFGKPIGKQQAIAFKLADMATRIRAARFLVYSAAELKEAHEPYGAEAAMAKMYASETAVEVANQALQIFGGAGYMKGMPVERMYRDAKITMIYEGTNEIQRLVVSASLLGKSKKAAPAAEQKPQGRKQQIFFSGSAAEKVSGLLGELKKDGVTLKQADSQGDGTVAGAKRLVSVGMGLRERGDLALPGSLASLIGAELSSSRPVAEFREWLPMDRFVGLSGKKFTGELYVAVGISGASQHLAGIKDAGVVIAINSDENAPIFKNCDYGVVGDLYEVLPLLIAELSK